MNEKRYLLRYSEYETSNGEIIRAEPYFIDTREEYVDEKFFTIDGYPTMSDEQVVDLLNKQEHKINALNKLTNQSLPIWVIEKVINRRIQTTNDTNIKKELNELLNELK